MIGEYSKRLSMSLLQNGFIPEGEEEACAFGIQTGAETLLGWTSGLLLGLILGMFWESAIFLVTYSAVRTYAGGYHAETFLQCFFSSCLLVVAVICLCRWFPQAYLPTGNALMLAVSAPIIWTFSLVASRHKPLDDEETVCYRKKCRMRLIVECAVAVALVMFGQARYAMVISVGLFVLSILMLCGLWQKKLER